MTSCLWHCCLCVYWVFCLPRPRAPHACVADNPGCRQPVQSGERVVWVEQRAIVEKANTIYQRCFRRARPPRLGTARFFGVCCACPMRAARVRVVRARSVQRKRHKNTSPPRHHSSSSSCWAEESGDAGVVARALCMVVVVLLLCISCKCFLRAPAMFYCFSMSVSPKQREVALICLVGWFVAARRLTTLGKWRLVSNWSLKIS